MKNGSRIRVPRFMGLSRWALVALAIALALSCAKREAKQVPPTIAPAAQSQAPAAAEAIPRIDPQAFEAFVELFPQLASFQELGGRDTVPVALDRDSVERILGWEGPPWRDPEPSASEGADADADESAQGPIGDADYEPERSFGFYALGRLALRDRIYLVVSRHLMTHNAYQGPRPEQSDESRVYELDSEGRTLSMASLASREVPQGSPGDGYDEPEIASINYDNEVFRMCTESQNSDKFGAIWTVSILPDGGFERNTEKAAEGGEGK
jgi:hypothetical protein